jgi:hypothetical protein
MSGYADRKARKAHAERHSAWLKQMQERGFRVTSENEIMQLDDQISLVALAWRRETLRFEKDITEAYRTLYALLQAKRGKMVSDADFGRMERAEGEYKQHDNVITIAELQRQARDRKVIK